MDRIGVGDRVRSFGGGPVGRVVRVQGWTAWVQYPLADQPIASAMGELVRVWA